MTHGTLDVAWTPAELEPSEAARQALVVIDVIRATTCITAALEAGARRVVPAPDDAEARRLHDLEPPGSALLCGEQGGLPPEGYDLGNSPGEYRPETVGGRVLVFATSNGTPAMGRATRGLSLRLASFRNLSAVARALTAELSTAGPEAGVTLVCAGRAGRVSMDDAWCAGHLVRGVSGSHAGLRLTDGARAALELGERLGDPDPERLAETAAGRALVQIGLDRDLRACARVDDCSSVPLWEGGAFVRGGG